MKKDLKITEAQLKKIVKSALLKEMKQARIGKFNWATCDVVDMPDGFISNEAGREAVKKAEKLAAVTAQMYGVPGFVCNLFNATFGDNPEKSRRDVIDKAKQKTSGKSKTLAFDLYTDEFEYLKSRSSQFVSTMSNNISSPSAQSIIIDRNEYEDAQRQIQNSTALTSDPMRAVEEINRILNIGDKGTKSKVRKLKKEQSIDDSEIVSQAVGSALLMHKSITSTNLRSSSMRSAYSTFPDYERFNNLTDN